jgi:hypothetical protein
MASTEKIPHKSSQRSAMLRRGVPRQEPATAKGAKDAKWRLSSIECIQFDSRCETFLFCRHRIIFGRRNAEVTLRKLELHQETLQNLTRKPDSREAGELTPDLTVIGS